MRRVVDVYAIRAREFSEAVARLGEHRHVDREFLRLLNESKRRHALCISAVEALDEFIRQGEPSANSSVSEQSPAELATEIDEAKREMVRAREHYKTADEQLGAVTSQAPDIGLNHPDGAAAMRVASQGLNAALEQYHAAVVRLADLLSEAR
jgi:hypothetical protein